MFRRVEQIVREEMDGAGAQEVLLPIPQPLELWQRSGRDKAYGPAMFRLTRPQGDGLRLSPTAEEVVTTSWRRSTVVPRPPVNLYQINWKYRDELRPRFGLLRGREFLMKDAYSFDVDLDSLLDSYQLMYDAYSRCSPAAGSRFAPSRRESGEIGGDVSREFMAVAAVGEDDFVWCPRATTPPTWKRRVGVAAGRGDREPDEPADGGGAHARGAGHRRRGRAAAGRAVDAAEVRSRSTSTASSVSRSVPGDREVNQFALAPRCGRAGAPLRRRRFRRPP